MPSTTTLRRAAQGQRKPIVTTYTSGTGTFTPAYTNGLARVVLVGGGGGGSGGYRSVYAQLSGGGGGAGATVDMLVWLLESSYTYSVGAGAAGSGAVDAGDGGETRLGFWIAPGGEGGTGVNVGSSPVEGFGGNGGGHYMFETGAGPVGHNGALAQGYMISGGGGGGPERGKIHSFYPGGPFHNDGSDRWPERLNGNDGGGGGSTIYGLGGDGGAFNAAGGHATVGYGGGGGGGGADSTTYETNLGGDGAGGLIIVVELGIVLGVSI